VKVTGAEAYRYVQTYWYPANRGFDGFDIGAHRDLAFCKDGTTPAVGRTDAPGVQWLFVDMNEQAFQDGLKLQFERLKKQGWDGVFFDRGYASLTGIDAANYDVWRRTSSCTDRPVVPGATFADSYLEIVHLAQSVGLKTMFNYGVSPFDPTTPLRPDPRDPPCILRLWTTCHKIDDAWNSTALVLDEAPSHPRDTEWARDFMVNRANEQDPAHGGQVVGLLTSAVLQSTERSVAYYEWARARLFSFPVGVNTGDGGCPPINTPCNRRRFFPELVSVTLGRPIEPEPTAQLCEPGSLINCLWKRRYERGAVVVNVSARPKTVSWQLGVEGCRYVLDVRTGQALADGRCTSTVVLSLDAWSGEPLQYSTKPF
jgi:hypothetical protein